MEIFDIYDGLDPSKSDGIINTQTMNNINNLSYNTWPGLRSLRLRRLVGQFLHTALPQGSYNAKDHLRSYTVSSAASGWTGITSSLDTHFIYVSDSIGSSTYDGLAPTFVSGIHGPKKTIADGVTLLRGGSADWLLLRRGDTFTNQNFGGFSINGRNYLERIVIGSYAGSSTVRPIIKTGLNSGFVPRNGCGSNVALIGLHFIPHTYASSSSINSTPVGIFVTNDSLQNFLIEDCKIEKYSQNILFNHEPGDPIVYNNITIRRNIIIDSFLWNDDNIVAANSTGVYIDSTNFLFLEENIIDHNGWREDVSGTQPGVYNNEGNFYRHNIFIQNGCRNVTLRGNIIARTDGALIRGEGSCNNNLFLNNAANLICGGGRRLILEGNKIPFNIIKGNVVIDGNDLSPTDPLGIGIAVGNTGSVLYNIVANQTSGADPTPVLLGLHAEWNEDGDISHDIGEVGLTVQNNIVYNWSGDDGSEIDERAMVTWEDIHSLISFHFDRNDIINNADSSYLMSIYYDTSTSEFHTSNNRYYRTTNPTGLLFFDGTSGVSFSAFMQEISDSTSQVVLPTYTSPSRTAGSYFSSLVSANGIISDGTLNSYMSALRLQSRNQSWNQSLMPTQGQTDTPIGTTIPGTTITNYIHGGTRGGPIRYLRFGFDLSGLGTQVNSIVPSSIASGTVTSATINGIGFTTLANSSLINVSFNGTGAAQIVLVNDSTITCNIPQLAHGLYNIVVDTGDGIDILPRGLVVN